MYLPPAFRSEDPELIREILRAAPFGTLITVAGDAPVVSHIPFVLDGDHVVGHLARANPQARALGSDVLVSIIGPHAYVSARWYREPSRQVPTWNYVALTIRGRPELVDAAAAVRRMAAVLDPRWIPGPVVDELAPAIVAFRLPLDRVELKLKLSQNRERADADRVQAALDGGCEAERAVAAWMARVG